MHILFAFVLLLAFIGPFISAAILRRLAVLLVGLIVVAGFLVSVNTNFNGMRMFVDFALVAGGVWALLRGIAWTLDGA